MKFQSWQEAEQSLNPSLCDSGALSSMLQLLRRELADAAVNQGCKVEYKLRRK